MASGLFPWDKHNSFQSDLLPKRERTSLLTPMFIAALFSKAKTWKKPKCPAINEWIKTMWYILFIFHNRILFSCKKKELLPFATAWCVDEPGWYSLYMKSKNKKANFIDTENGTVVVRGWGEGKVGDRSAVVRVSFEDLMYDTSTIVNKTVLYTGE